MPLAAPRGTFLPMSRIWRVLLCLAAAGAPGCGTATPRPSLTIPELDTSRGNRVYRGDVYAPDAASPAFTYERYVADCHATHVTRDPAGRPVVLHAATVDPNGELTRFEAIQSQTGTAASLERVRDRTTFRVTRGDRRRTRQEVSRDPLVVGPTLFPFVVRHWDALVRRGEPIDLDFAVPERGRSYPFELYRETSGPTTTIVVMRPRSPWLRAVIAPIRMTWATPTRTILRYEGRVPPQRRRGQRWRPLDARVEYTHYAEEAIATPASITCAETDDVEDMEVVMGRT